jgi:hypothetical protein
MRRTFCLATALLIGFLAPAAAGVSMSDQVSLQAAMQRHIDRQSVDGVYLHLDPKSGEVQKLHPLTAHPKIMRMGEGRFVLCFDFRNEAGKKVDVDFYMARKGKGYVVFHQAVNGHDLLGRLMSEGKVRP